MWIPLHLQLGSMASPQGNCLSLFLFGYLREWLWILGRQSLLHSLWDACMCLSHVCLSLPKEPCLLLNVYLFARVLTNLALLLCLFVFLIYIMLLGTSHSVSYFFSVNTTSLGYFCIAMCSSNQLPLICK